MGWIDLSNSISYEVFTSIWPAYLPWSNTGNSELAREEKKEGGGWGLTKRAYVSRMVGRLKGTGGLEWRL